MVFKTDIEIASSVQMEPIEEVVRGLGIVKEDLISYGQYKAKLLPHNMDELAMKKNGKLILVTAMTPTPAGEGKTTMSVGLGDGLNVIGKNTMIALREPSLGPVFGMKGGATGGGQAQLLPMEDINLHFTGDLHAITSAHNLLAAMLDNHIFHGNTLQIDLQAITWKRVVDMNDRQLRVIEDGLGGKHNGVPRSDGFDITVASEVMAIFCLATDLEDLKARLGKIIIAFNVKGQPVTAHDLKAEGAMTALLRDAFVPNVVQTIEHNPALVHGGPFANIAHGCNSIVATQLALKYSDYVVTEAGFGADLGAEKFLDIFCRTAQVVPDAVVVVATIRSLKMHGGVPLDQLDIPNAEAVFNGGSNLRRHINNLCHVFGLPVVVALNQFTLDHEAEIEAVQNICDEMNVPMRVANVWSQGGVGAVSLAEKVVELCEHAPTSFDYAYNLEDTIDKKIRQVAEKIYGAKDVEFSKLAAEQLQRIQKLGFNDLPICIAKTQYSFSDNAKLLGAPSNFSLHVKELKLSAGAGFIVVITGKIMTMPGLPKNPAAETIDVDRTGGIVGLF